MTRPESRVSGKPNARVVFPEGDYNHAIQCYFQMSEWLRNSGATMVEGMEGVLHHPAHPLESPLARVVTNELIDTDGWSITVDFYCDGAALAWLSEQALPQGASLVIPDSGALVPLRER